MGIIAKFNEHFFLDYGKIIVETLEIWTLLFVKISYHKKNKISIVKINHQIKRR